MDCMFNSCLFVLDKCGLRKLQDDYGALWRRTLATDPCLSRDKRSRAAWLEFIASEIVNSIVYVHVPIFATNALQLYISTLRIGQAHFIKGP
jgi:hypothetical protein